MSEEADVCEVALALEEGATPTKEWHSALAFARAFDDLLWDHAEHCNTILAGLRPEKLSTHQLIVIAAVIRFVPDHVLPAKAKFFEDSRAQVAVRLGSERARDLI